MNLMDTIVLVSRIMVIEKLESYVIYRNYETLDLNVDSKTNILYGDNAQGKTNILEAIYICSTTKSHRGGKDKEVIKFGCDDAHIKIYINKKNKEYRIDIHLKKNKSKGIAINGIPLKKASELFGIFNVVFFSPEDLNIIKNGPSERRRFIDLELCQLDKLYVYNLLNYNKILNQRNKLLKDLYFKPDLEETLDVWDLQLAKYGSEVIKRRSEFVKKINEIINPIHKKITDNKENIIVKYDKNCDELELYNQLVLTREKDKKYKTTNVGPHRDDLSFYYDDMNVRIYGSQGQQRTAALSLKLAEIEIVKSIIHDTPVLLLDDVLSELDSKRQNELLNSLENVQTIITCTGLDEFIENRFKINKIFNVKEGKVFEKTI